MLKAGIHGKEFYFFNDEKSFNMIITHLKKKKAQLLNAG